MSYTDYVTAALLSPAPAALWTLDETSGTSVVDDTGNGRTGTYAGSPTLNQTSTIPGYDGPVVVFDGTNDSISVADHASLEAVDATGFTYQQWIRFDNAGSDALQIIADKTGTSQANNQWGIWWDNRSAQGSPLRLRIQWGDNPTGISLDWSGTAARDALNTGGLLTVVFHTASSGYIYWNDDLVASGDLYNHPNSANNAANTRLLYIGSLSGTGSWFKGWMGAGAVWGTHLPEWRVAALYGEGSGTRVVEVAIVSSPAKLFETADYDSFPGLVVCPNGDLLGVWRKGTAHTTATSGQGLYSARSTDGGATWSSMSNAISNDASTQYATAALSVIGSDVWLATWVRPLAGGATNPATAVRLFSSSDNGATWTLASTLDLSALYPNGAYTESSLVYLGGYYYLACYGQTSGTATDFEAGMFRSSDLSTWTRVAQWDGGLDTYTETGVTLVGSTLVAVIRHNSGFDHYTSTSTDGTTWSTPAKVRDLSSGGVRASNASMGPGGLSYFVARQGQAGAMAYVGTVDSSGTIREVLKLSQVQNMYGQVAAVTDERIVVVWSVQASSSDADIYSARWDITGYTFDVADTAATAAAAAHLESVYIPIGLTDAAATAAASAHVETVAIGVALLDDPAASAAAAHVETLTIPLALVDDTATASTAAHVETVVTTYGLDLDDDTATSEAEALLERVDTNTLGPWLRGASGEALLFLDTPAGVLEVTYPAEAAPANIVEVPLSWQSHESAVVGGDTSGMVSVPLGTPHAWVDGVDVTYFRGIPTIIGAPRQEAPGSWTSATLTFPQVFHYEERGTGDLSWMRADAPVEIAIVTPLGARIHRFTGQMTSEDPGTGRDRTSVEWQCGGILWQSNYAHHPVPARLDPTDSGKLIVAELMGTPSRRFTVNGPNMGILSRKRGSHRTTRWDYAIDQLATAVTPAGDQWTIQPTGKTSFELALKDTTTVHWTITAGAPGVEIDLSKDHHERIDAVYASGVGPDGYAWSNIFFPDILPYDPPGYPYSDPDQMFGLGATDAGTLTGTGISDWQRRIRDLGYTAIAIDGVMGSADIAAVRWIQRKRGIQVDGVPGPQTFAATWNIGAVGGDLSTIRLPMAWRSEVEPFLYGANGAVVGTNPDYDPSIIRHEIDVDLGAGVTKEQGREMCQRILERGMDPGWTGTLRLTTCPWEGSRHEVNAGDNVLLKGWQGGDVLARVVKVDPDWQSLDTPVTLTIDSEFRDAMAVVEILDRNRESRADPARRPGNPNRRSRMDQDMVTPFEGESPAGRLPRLPLFEGLWTVWPVPVSEVGLIAKLRFVTSGPATRFAVALFGCPITANQVAAKVPDPLAVSRPWDNVGDAWLEQFGLIETWGEQGQAMGYGMMGAETSGSALTGVFYDDAGVPYVSQVSPWVWVALYSPVSCFIEGRIYPDVTQ